MCFGCGCFSQAENEKLLSLGVKVTCMREQWKPFLVLYHKSLLHHHTEHVLLQCNAGHHLHWTLQWGNGQWIFAQDQRWPTLQLQLHCCWVTICCIYIGTKFGHTLHVFRTYLLVELTVWLEILTAFKFGCLPSNPVNGSICGLKIGRNAKSTITSLLKECTYNYVCTRSCAKMLAVFDLLVWSLTVKPTI